jgi:hypothetical protein
MSRAGSRQAPSLRSAGGQPGPRNLVQRVQRAATELGANEGYATFFAFGHLLRD